MFGLDYNGHAKGMQGFLDAVADLLGEAFLNLKAAGIGFHYTGDFAEAGDFAVGNIGYVAFADEREQVMLAGGVEVDVFHQNHLAILLVEDSLAHYGNAVFRVAFCQELKGFCHPFRSFLKPLAGSVFAKQIQYCTHVFRNFCGYLRIVFIFSVVCHCSAKIRNILQYPKIVYLCGKFEETMFWTLELASSLDDAPWPATKEELIDYANRSGAPEEVIENLQELEEDGEIYETIEDIWPDYPTKDDFFWNEEEY